jgi:hypothetical protein
MRNTFERDGRIFTRVSKDRMAMILYRDFRRAQHHGAEVTVTAKKIIIGLVTWEIVPSGDWMLHIYRTTLEKKYEPLNSIYFNPATRWFWEVVQLILELKGRKISEYEFDEQLSARWAEYRSATRR